MAALLLVLCYGMKAVVAVEARASGLQPLGLARWLAFAAIWFGMQPREFSPVPSGRVRVRSPSTVRLVLCGLVWSGAGVAVLVTTARCWHSEEHLQLAGLLFVLGFSMCVHFGLIHLLAALLRSCGFATEPQFHAPWRASSLQDFWGRRWNAAFAAMTVLAIYRPLASRIGRGAAIMAGFLASGLLHEVACSLPVRAGFGGPGAHFALHGVGVWIERWFERRGRLLRGVPARVWVWTWVLLPLPLLFHQPFLRGVVLPWLVAAR
ncbi:MAG: hypothetical protein H6836_01720 [Planctomycetes bacterium]|nr:hypothetical protein [Planctomycetota bacterium]